MAWGRVLRDFRLSPAEFWALSAADALALFFLSARFDQEDRVAQAVAIKTAFLEGDDWKKFLAEALPE